MTKTSKFFILAAVLLLFLLSLNIAHAASFDVKAVPIKDKIAVNEIAEYNISIQNNLDTDEEYLIKKTGYPFWDMFTKPLQSPITLKVPAGTSASINLFVEPLYITSEDTYTLNVGVVRQSGGEEQKVPVTIAIGSTEALIGGYVPTVLTSASISPETIDPRNEIKVKIVLKNQNVLDYPNLTIKIESDLFTDELQYHLGPLEDKTIEITKKLDDMTPPQQDKVVIAVFRGDRLIVSPIVNEFEIKEYVVQDSLPTEKSFLKIRNGIKVTSNNRYYSGTIKIESSPLKNLFLSTSPRAEIVKDNGKDYLVWDIKLDNNRTMAVYTSENYRPLVVIVVLTIAAIILYFLFRSPIVVRKSIANVGMSEGGVSEAKVVVRVKNRSRNQITNIEVLDNLPHIAHVEKELSIGSMQPHAILKHPKKGILIKWIIETIEPGDERVLSYKMKSTLSILGEFNMPAATARCKVGNRVIISNSNRVSVGG